MSLSGEWWRDPELFAAEYERHGSINAMAAAHQRAESNLRKWRDRHGLPARPMSPRAAPQPARVYADEVSGEDLLRQRNAELAQALRAGRERSVFEERLLHAVKATLVSAEPKYSPRVIKGPGKLDKHEFVLLWSDTHAGEKVSREETNGLNQYDWEIMMRRHDEIRRGILSYLDNRPYPVDRLHVLALGDMLSGDIHEELSETNEFPIVECATQFGLDAAEWLESFVPRFREIRFSGIVGNHPRLSKKPRAKQKFNNFDWLTYQIMRQRLSRVKSISWEIPKAQKWPVEVCGRRIVLSHGDGVRSSMVGVPWGGIIRHFDRLQNEYSAAGMSIDHLAVGHWHEGNVVKNRKILVNGSVKGIDEYGLHAFGGGSSPHQLLCVFHPRHGLTETCFIDLEPALRKAA